MLHLKKTLRETKSITKSKNY